MRKHQRLSDMNSNAVRSNGYSVSLAPCAQTGRGRWAWVLCVGGLLAACGTDTDKGNPEMVGDGGHLGDISPVDPVDVAGVFDTHSKDAGVVADVDTATSDSSPDAEPEADLANNPCPEGKPCDDTDPCTADDRCGPSGCSGTAYVCDDGRSCTDDVCLGNGNCKFSVREGHCLIGNVCYADGELSPLDSCGLCDSKTSQNEFVDSAVDVCDDGSLCTTGDHCEAGICVGDPIDCDDNNPCTEDGCAAPSGCSHSAVFNSPCDDGNACTLEDQCGPNGECLSGPGLPCEDGNPCTTNICDPLIGCVQTDNDIACSDGNVCTVGDQCQGGVCVPGEEAACNDGNSCTDDSCLPQQGCNHVLTDNPCCTSGTNICNDNNPCTVDLCDPLTNACQYEPYAGGCNDGNSCTTGDMCSNGQCAGKPKECSDGNPCTVDGCSLGQCTHMTAPDSTPCDDGQECSFADQCVAGVCMADTSACVCVPVFSENSNKINSLSIGKDGQVGSGVDVDNNAATCAPASNCSGGIDNTLSAIAGFANDPLADAITSGSIVLLLEHDGYMGNSTPFTVHIYTGGAVDDTCDIQNSTCEYLVDPVLLNEDCEPLVTLGNAKVLGGKLTAGGPGANLPLSLPIAGLAINVTVYNARIDVKVTVAGGKITTLNGVLGGAVKKSELKAAITALPDDTFPAGFDKATIIGFLDILVAEDIDLDGNGTKDAASIGFALTAIGANLVGVLN